MKYLFLLLVLATSINSFGQIRVTQGNNNAAIEMVKQPVFTSFSSPNNNYFVSCHTDNFQKINNLIITDKAGNIVITKDISLSMGTMNNSYDVKNLLVVGYTPLLFVQHRTKADGKNAFTARVIDQYGNIGTEELPIASMDYTKWSNAGDWYSALTPDKKHVAVIGKSPYEKGQPNQFSFYILDEQLQVINKGQFSFTAANGKEIRISDFLASDKGDLYIVAADFDKSYKYPILYQYSSSGVATITPVTIGDAGLKNFNYISRITPAGDLLIAGYMQKKESFSMGDTKSVGTWIFNSSKPSEVKTSMFDKPVTNATARNIVYNGDTFFLVGEQYKATAAENTTTGMGTLNMTDPVYDYQHGDVLVTGFAMDGIRKYDVSSPRIWNAKNFDQDLMIASGIINNKLVLVYNDQCGKYVDDIYRRNHKLAVAVAVNNNGLMEAPQPFVKDFDFTYDRLRLYPQFFNADNNKLMLLYGNPEETKVVTFQ